MPLDITTWTAKLTANLTIGGTQMFVDNFADVQAELDNGNHLILTVYTAARSEVVLVSAHDGTSLTIARAYDGTTAQPWPCAACVRALQVVTGPAPVCPPETDTSDLPLINGMPVVGSDCVDVEVIDGEIVVSLKPTGVEPGNYGGMVVGQCGRIVELPADWPNVIPFDACPC